MFTIILTNLAVQMILELRKACLEAIDRALSNLNIVKMQWSSSFPKPAQQKLHSVLNDVELLKDNFTLIATKVLRLESKCNEKETMAMKVESKYRSKFEEASEAYKILEVKHEKLGKQLSFIKFSNNCLRVELQSLQNKQAINHRLNSAIREIEKLVSSNGENLQNNINRIICTVQKQDVEDCPVIEKSFGFDLNANKCSSHNLNLDHHEIEFHSQLPIVQQQALREQKMVINSCELKTDRDQLKTKKKLLLGKDSSESKETVSTEKKKRNELAKLVEQQGRLSRINERYLSTDIF